MGPNILNTSGTNIVNEKRKIKQFFLWFLKNWKTVVPILISIFALMFSFCSNTTSKDSNRIAKDALNISQQARDDFRESAKLDINPNIVLQIYPTYFEIKNLGPVKAEQFKIKLIQHMASPNSDSTNIVSMIGPDWKYPEIDIENSQIITIPDPWNNSNYYLQWSKVNKNVIENVAIEIFLEYRREQDLKLYQKRAFYFFDSQGNIIMENSIINNPKYKKILNVLYKYLSGIEWSKYPEMFSITATLHDVE